MTAPLLRRLAASLLLTSCDAATTLHADVFSQACATAEDCAPVLEGDSCRYSCLHWAALREVELPRWYDEVSDLRARCEVFGPARCTYGASPEVACVDGTCAVEASP